MVQSAWAGPTRPGLAGKAVLDITKHPRTDTIDFFFAGEWGILTADPLPYKCARHFQREPKTTAPDGIRIDPTESPSRQLHHQRVQSQIQRHLAGLCPFIDHEKLVVKRFQIQQGISLGLMVHFFCNEFMQAQTALDL